MATHAAIAATAVADGLAAEVVRLSAELRRRDVADLVAKNRDKIPPALDAWAATQSLDSLKAKRAWR